MTNRTLFARRSLLICGAFVFGGFASAQNTDATPWSTPEIRLAINFVWVLVCGFLVMIMQAGFAMVETGMCRAKNAAHVMSMNFLVYALGMTGFFICGYALMCGGANATAIGAPAQLQLNDPSILNKMFSIGRSIDGDHGWGFLGHSGFFLAGQSLNASAVVWFFYMMVFMDTTATIPTGALAERWNFKSFFIFSVCIGAFIYPIYGCWVWGGGWIAQLGYRLGLGHGGVDYAGSSVVHMQGGVIALICAVLLGPRIGKYRGKQPMPLLAHHVPMVIIGSFILAFGWFGFNAGSSLAGTDKRIGIIAANTMLASGAGALASCIYVWLIHPIGKPDPTIICNGMLAGLVSITAPCAFIQPWHAFLIGAVAGVIVVISVFFFERRGVDDPVGAISVHGVGGLWGVIAVGLFADGTHGDGYQHVAGNVAGLFYGNPKQLVAQLIMAASCIAWNVIVAGGIFWGIGKLIGTNRVPPEVEIAGLDIAEMGIPGYPEFIAHLTPEQVPRSQVADARRAQ